MKKLLYIVLSCAFIVSFTSCNVAEHVAETGGTYPDIRQQLNGDKISSDVENSGLEAVSRREASALKESSVLSSSGSDNTILVSEVSPDEINSDGEENVHYTSSETSEEDLVHTISEVSSEISEDKTQQNGSSEEDEIVSSEEPEEQSQHESGTPISQEPEPDEIYVDDVNIFVHDLNYTGEYMNPVISVSYRGKSLGLNVDYTAEFDRAPRDIGKYKATFTMKGKYKGKKTINYYVKVFNTRITKSSSKTSSISLEWKDMSEYIEGYQIDYSEGKSFDKAQTRQLNTKETSAFFDNLKTNSTQYFRIRTYKTVNNKKYYSSWSKTYTVKLKTIKTVDGVTYVDGILIANKTYSLPPEFGRGEDPEALEAFNNMAAQANKDGLYLFIVSGYRSYSTQESTYNYFKWERGSQAADRVSARPGHSEHQTGLAFDINTTSNAFAGTPEAIWLAEHCVEYGFIIRYPEDKESITGYIYEPWHIRYLGKEKAAEIAKSGLTIEEYYGITSEYE